MSSRLDANLTADSNRECIGDRRVVHETELGARVKLYVDDVPVPTEDCEVTEEEFVVVDAKKPGLALLLGFETFNNGEEPRPGVKKDLVKMYELFHEHLGFEVQWKKDLTADECRKWIEDVTSDTELLQRISCVVMVISSHGSEAEVGKKGDINPDFRRQEIKFYQHWFSTTDGSIQTSDIIDMFDDYKCRALKGKPKVFFIQACRGRVGEDQTLGDMVDGGVSIRFQSEPSKEPIPLVQPVVSSQNNPVVQNEESHTRMDAKGIRASDVIKGSKLFTEGSGHLRAPLENEIALAPPPCFHNCMIVMASPPGKAAWSEQDTGGWLITCLYRVYMNHVNKGHKIRMIRSMTKINYLMAMTMESITNEASLNFMKCVPVTTHMLERDIVLVPKNLQ
ncbi:caspase-7-like [Saccostrea echinata]|uniref:caspase-7-like n=1 Tax=Saccostrea echinata TaxID=191078 RepID=UPI002A838DE1|nr:caspase-7-like [Saccostrea echinata]